jgi:hypothetical protein
MKKSIGDKGLSDIEKINNYLISLGFICQSQSSSQNQIYSKNGNVIIVSNNKR